MVTAVAGIMPLFLITACTSNQIFLCYVDVTIECIAFLGAYEHHLVAIHNITATVIEVGLLYIFVGKP